MHPFSMQAVRDNDRICIENPSLAKHLWKATGLDDVFASIKVDGMTAVGLNPNIRFYRCVIVRTGFKQFKFLLEVY